MNNLLTGTILWKSDGFPPNCRTGRPISDPSAAGYGERVADLRHPCTDLGKNVPWIPL